MNKHLQVLFSLASLLACLTSTSCGTKDDPVIDHFSHVAIYYGCGYNNLSADLESNIVDELASGEIPEKNDNKAMVAFCHNTAYPYDYSTANAPVLLRIYKDNGKAVIDTVETYPLMTISASASTLTSVLNDVKSRYKSDSYGLIFSSHASGWLPEGYKSPDSEKTKISVSSIGSQCRGSASVTTEIDINDFANAIPYKLDYAILDCCLAGGIEVAWELRKVCEKIVFSPTEILASGYDYDNMAKRLFSTPSDLEGICKDHFNKYQYATTTLVDCSQIGCVAEAMQKIISAHNSELDLLKCTPVGKRTVQKYFYDEKYYIYFYDLRHTAVKIGATGSELAELDAALKKFVIAENHSEKFLENLSLDNVCGVSMFIPHNDWPKLNSYYKGLGWNNVVKVVDN